MYKRLLQISFLTFALTGAVSMAVPASTSALSMAPSRVMAATSDIDCKGGVHPVEFNGDRDTRSCCPASAGQTPTSRDCLFAKYINPVVNLLSALVGVIVLASVIWGAIQYSSAGGDSNKVAAAKDRILSSLGALAGFVFLYVFLQWVIPGGIV